MKGVQVVFPSKEPWIKITRISDFNEKLKKNDGILLNNIIEYVSDIAHHPYEHPDFLIKSDVFWSKKQYKSIDLIVGISDNFLDVVTSKFLNQEFKKNGMIDFKFVELYSDQDWINKKGVMNKEVSLKNFYKSFSSIEICFVNYDVLDSKFF